jgi:hypothetical protein
LPPPTVPPAESLAALAGWIFDHAAAGPLDEARRRAADSAPSVAGLNPVFASLEQDPTGGFYIAAHSGGGDPLLAAFPANAAAPSLPFKDALDTGTLALPDGRSIAVRLYPFGSRDWTNVRLFAERLAPAFLPRPQRDLPAVAAGNRHPEICLPAVFEAFRRILETTGVNWASTVQLSATREMTTDDVIAARDGENPVAAGHTRVSIRHLYHAGLQAAILSGWRAGYNAEADHFIVTGNTAQEIARSVEASKEAIRHAAGYTKFTTDTSRLFELEADPRHPSPWSDAAVRERFELILTPEERRWVLAEFGRPFPIGSATYRFDPGEIERLTVKFARSLKLNEELYDYIREVKRTSSPAAEFDFEPSLDEAATLTTAKELLFYMHWLRARGRPAQLVPPKLGFKKRQAYPESVATRAGSVGLEAYAEHHMWPELLPRVTGEFASRPLEELAARVAELAEVARHFDGTLSIHSGSGKQAAVLEQIGRSTGGRVNYKISGELQLQLFDVISSLPPSSPWRQIYARMVDRAEQFAAAGTFGAESALARHYRGQGLGDYLGDPARGRVDGNLFLVFWLGNLVGSRDFCDPAGDTRFFKEKLDELPGDLVAEVRRRNTNYIAWLASHLRA